VKRQEREDKVNSSIRTEHIAVIPSSCERRRKQRIWMVNAGREDRQEFFSLKNSILALHRQMTAAADGALEHSCAAPDRKV
jgi:hypothetical protein